MHGDDGIEYEILDLADSSEEGVPKLQTPHKRTMSMRDSNPTQKKQRRERTPKGSLEENACDSGPEIIAIERSDKRCCLRIREQPDEDIASGDGFETHVLAGSGKHRFSRIAEEPVEDDAFDDGMDVLGIGWSDNHNRARL